MKYIKHNVLMKNKEREDRLCTRCQKFNTVNWSSRRNLCAFCIPERKRIIEKYGSDFSFTPGSKRNWVGAGECPIDLQLPA